MTRRIFDRVRAIDTDTHISEPPDLWTSRVSTKKWGDAVPHVERIDGRDVWRIRDQMVDSPGFTTMAGFNGSPPEGQMRYDDIPSSILRCQTAPRAHGCGGHPCSAATSTSWRSPSRSSGSSARPRARRIWPRPGRSRRGSRDRVALGAVGRSRIRVRPRRKSCPEWRRGSPGFDAPDGSRAAWIAARPMRDSGRSEPTARATADAPGMRQEIERGEPCR